MTYTELRDLTRPWKGPFRVRTTSGETYDVWQREGFLLTTGCLHIGLLNPGTEDYGRTIYLDPAHVEHVERLETPAPTEGNGQREG